MDVLRTVLDLLRPERSRPPVDRPIAPVPPVIAQRLIPDNPYEPLFPRLKRYGKGQPGTTQEEEDCG